MRREIPPPRTCLVFPVFRHYGPLRFSRLSFFSLFLSFSGGARRGWGFEGAKSVPSTRDDAIMLKKSTTDLGLGTGPGCWGGKRKERKRKKRVRKILRKKPHGFFSFLLRPYIYIYIQLKTTQFLRSPLPPPPLLRLAFGFCFEPFTLLSKNINIYFLN